MSVGCQTAAWWLARQVGAFIGLFRDIKESQAAYRELQEKGYVRYENLPLESRSGEKVEVEFVSNSCGKPPPSRSMQRP